MPSKRTPKKPAALARRAKKQPANPKQAAELFQEGQRILAARSTAAIAGAATTSDTASGGAAGESDAAADRATPPLPASAAGKDSPDDEIHRKISYILASSDENVKTALRLNIIAYLEGMKRMEAARTALPSDPTAAPIDSASCAADKIDAAGDRATPQPSAPDSEIPDDLRIPVISLSDAQKKAARKQLLARMSSALADINTHDLQTIAQFADMLNRGRGCTTPAEELVENLVNAHYFYGGITPDLLAQELDTDNPDGFKSNFEDAVITARDFQTFYPNFTEAQTE